ncbi:MAG: DUF1501 domain-containing protein [Epsilonproteobacteria bacterium]|nr:DUF1501 domain-containing protein [Campylobacterota bacterium]
MKRRGFIKLSAVASFCLLFESNSSASDIDMSKVNFSKDIYETNQAQTVIVFLYGGASQLGGNLTNLEDINAVSQSDYNYFRGLTKTTNGCWQEAGGAYMESMISSSDLTLFRCCYSKIREETNNKAHGICISQNQKGSFNDNTAGMITNIAKILSYNGVIDENTMMPFVTLDGDSEFYAQGDKPLDAYLKPVGFDASFNNPYERRWFNWADYSREEREENPDTYHNYIPKVDATMTNLAQGYNTNQKIKSAFDKRSALSDFVDTLSSATTPDLGEDAYPSTSDFAKRVEGAIKILDGNKDTKIVTLSTSGMGGWDDHDDARNYVTRMDELFATLKSAMAHLKALNKDNKINIVVFSDFGRNVNLNSAFGWDHGNLQNLYVLGGKDYFTHKGVVGETVLDDVGAINRLYLKPKSGTYEFEPISIASMLYKIYGVQNPEVLTGGYEAVDI